MLQELVVDIGECLQEVTYVYKIRSFRNEKVAGPSLLLQRLLGLLLGTGENIWPIADRRVPSHDPRNISGTHFGSNPFSFLRWQTGAESVKLLQAA